MAPTTEGRYEHLDSDASRLPEGMQRIGYDADTQRYTFQDTTDGSFWESEEGNRYGTLHPAGQQDQILPNQPLLVSEDFSVKKARQSDISDFLAGRNEKTQEKVTVAEKPMESSRWHAVRFMAHLVGSAAVRQRKSDYKSSVLSSSGYYQGT